jgi:hypothetical protein
MQEIRGHLLAQALEVGTELGNALVTGPLAKALETGPLGKALVTGPLGKALVAGPLGKALVTGPLGKTVPVAVTAAVGRNARQVVKTTTSAGMLVAVPFATAEELGAMVAVALTVLVTPALVAFTIPSATAKEGTPTEALADGTPIGVAVTVGAAKVTVTHVV